MHLLLQLNNHLANLDLFAIILLSASEKYEKIKLFEILIKYFCKKILNSLLTFLSKKCKIIKNCIIEKINRKIFDFKWIYHSVSKSH